MGRKKAQKQEPAGGTFPRFAVTAVEETDAEREERGMTEALAAADRRAERRRSSFDGVTKEHVRQLLVSVLEAKNRFRNKDRGPTGDEEAAIVARALKGLDASLSKDARALVQEAAELVMSSTRDAGKVGEDIRQFSIQFALDHAITKGDDTDDQSVVDIVASIPRA